MINRQINSPEQTPRRQLTQHFSYKAEKRKEKREKRKEKRR